MDRGRGYEESPYPVVEDGVNLPYQWLHEQSPPSIVLFEDGCVALCVCV